MSSHTNDFDSRSIFDLFAANKREIAVKLQGTSKNALLYKV